MRVVIDTNVVLDWLVFDDPSVRALVGAVESGRVVAVSREDCVEELRRVLGYPAFGMDAHAQAASLARYGRHVRVVDTPGARSPLPLCSDADDQKFLELAWHAEADVLVTKDKALLRMARRVARFGRFVIASPAALAV